MRGQAEQESEALVQQAESERRSLRGELRLLRAQEAELREELCGAKQVSRCCLSFRGGNHRWNCVKVFLTL